jgi:hypothetical protein
MKKIITIAILAITLSGCATVDTVKKYWPRDHDPEMFGALVDVDIAVERVNCETPNWSPSVDAATRVARLSEWRGDPQATNLKGLQAHTERMSRGGSRVFCDLGKKTAAQRIQAAKSAWEGR